MFEHFTFTTAVGRTSYCSVADYERAISPSDCSSVSPVTPPPSCQSFPQVVAGEEIVLRFAQQTLQTEEDETAQTTFCKTDSQDDYVLTGMSFTSTPLEMMEVSTHLPPLSDLAYISRCKRSRRQQDVHLQSSASHLKDISALVEDMISTESQCVLRQPPSRSAPAPPMPAEMTPEEFLVVDQDEILYHRPNEPFTLEVDDNIDEGFVDMEDEILSLEADMTLRRACLPTGIRKYNGLKWPRSYEIAGLASSSTGVPPRPMVRSKPRMRRRKPKTSRET